MDYEEYVAHHMMQARGQCALANFQICTCNCDGGDGFKKGFEAGFADAISKFAPRVVEQPAPLPVEVIDKFLPYDSLYELTLTTNSDDIYTLRQWFAKIVKSAMFEVRGFMACIELQKNGNPHIHALIFSKKKYCDGTKIAKSLKFPWRYTFSRVRMPNNYYEYLNKEHANPDVIQFCAQKGVDQFWDELF